MRIRSECPTNPTSLSNRRNSPTSRKAHSAALHDLASFALSTGARVLGAALAVGLSIEYVETWPDRIGDVTVADVNAAARAVLKVSQSVTSLLLQKKTG